LSGVALIVFPSVVFDNGTGCGEKTRFYLLYLAPLQATVDEDPQPAVMCVYGGLSRFLSSVNDVGRVTQCKEIVRDGGGFLSRLWAKQ